MNNFGNVSKAPPIKIFKNTFHYLALITKESAELPFLSSFVVLCPANFLDFNFSLPNNPFAENFAHFTLNNVLVILSHFECSQLFQTLCSTVTYLTVLTNVQNTIVGGKWANFACSIN